MTTGSTSKENGTHQTPNNQTDDLDDLEIPDPDDPVNSLPVPPDGGWGWVIMFASLMCNVIVDGVCFSFGIFFVEFLDYFKEGAAKTAWVGSLLPGMYLSAGPVVSALANKYGCRSVTIAGAILAAISFIASTFSPNVDVLIITYGVLGGLGFGLMYLPAIVIVGFYFDKRRALATGIAVCGSGIGTFIFAPLTRFLISTYGWKGGLWIISGITLNGIVCGALFRPLTGQYLTKKSNRSTHNEEVEDQKVTGEIMKRIIEDKKRLRTVSTGSLDGTVITKDNTLIKDPEVIKKLNLDTNKNKFNAMKPLLETEDTEQLSTPIYKPNGVAKKHIFLNKNIARVQSLEGLNLPPQMRNRTRSDCSEIRKKKKVPTATLR